ncbi:MAG: hypothetical protein P8J87_05085 [Verrucomicrobiales bacterium]|nr:hypothetical protein [Verrucomicrobiales bacterium]
MRFPFSPSQIWRRQIERAIKPGAQTTAPVRFLLAASILGRRAGEMKRLLTGARKNSNPITPELLATTARRYSKHGSVVTEIARCLRDQNLPSDALSILRQHHSSCADPTVLLKLWHELIRTAKNPSTDDFRAFQQALERGIRTTADSQENRDVLCRFWIDHRRIFCEPSTVDTQVSAFLSSSLPSTLAERERDLLAYVLSRSGAPSDTTQEPAACLPAIPATSELLVVCTSRTSLPSLQPVVDQLQADGHHVRTFCLDCLDRRDIYWSDHAGTRTHKEPAYSYLGDQRLSSLRLLVRLLESHPQAIVPAGDAATSFLSALPEKLRPVVSTVTTSTNPNVSSAANNNACGE